ncbi:hypothetical protein WJX84_005121 [Apatococcus fuscideae]|uniref:F-box domain-containing protein n=1 Tax=Apatococcus fuscideae TaxID=2026836 RepID=A0AAW1STY4_9CHLO
MPSNINKVPRSLLDLPQEILTHILLLLDFRTRCCVVPLISRQLADWTRQPSQLWRNLEVYIPAFLTNKMLEWMRVRGAGVQSLLLDLWADQECHGASVEPHSGWLGSLFLTMPQLRNLSLYLDVGPCLGTQETASHAAPPL